MPRRNRNVRTRNQVGRHTRQYTKRTQFEARNDRVSSGQSALPREWIDESPQATGYSAKLD